MIERMSLLLYLMLEKYQVKGFNETQFYFCSVPDCYAEYVVKVILNKQQQEYLLSFNIIIDNA